MPTISEQAGGGRVIDLGAAAWHHEDGGTVPPGAARIMADKAKFDQWVDAMGGFAGKRFTELYREAVEFAGPAGTWSYLDMARRSDEEHAASPGKWLAEAAIELANARSAREATKRAEAAAAAAFERAAEIKLAAESLLSDPRLAGDPDFSTRPPMGRAEVLLELRVAMGLVNRPPTLYESTLPPVSDLARMIGVK